ncbi:MAG: crossover junction endodeoxyribonuclease RuvC [Clostridia bacterium]|nr:crossover junction endodeoxyribonuclease RuvC [Clostridia bacterium]
MTKIVLGIDPGIADTGYGFIKVHNSNLTCLAYGSIKTDSKDSLELRLLSMYQELMGLIKEYKPNEAAVEQLFFNKNVRTALIVGQARGVALLALSAANLKVTNFSPPQVKQAVTAYGRASKKQVQRMVKLILSLSELPQPDDAADALAVAICAANNQLY